MARNVSFPSHFNIDNFALIFPILFSFVSNFSSAFIPSAFLSALCNDNVRIYMNLTLITWHVGLLPWGIQSEMSYAVKLQQILLYL